eukprot:gene9257-16407_t
MQVDSDSDSELQDDEDAIPSLEPPPINYYEDSDSIRPRNWAAVAPPPPPEAPPVQLYGLKLGMACQFDSDSETQLCASRMMSRPYMDSPYCFASFLAPGILVAEGNQVTRTTSSLTDCCNLCEALGDECVASSLFYVHDSAPSQASTWDLMNPCISFSTVNGVTLSGTGLTDNIGTCALFSEVFCSPGNSKFFNPEHEMDALDDPFTYAATTCTNDIEAYCRMDNHQQLSGAVARSYSSLTALQQLPVPRTGAVLWADKSEVVSSISDSTAQAVLGKYDIESGVKFVGEILEVGTKKSSAACAAQCGLSENCTGFTYIEVPTDTWVTGSQEERPQQCIIVVQLAKAQSGIKKQAAVAVRQFDMIFDMDYAAVMGNMDKFKEDVKAALLESLGDKADVEVVSVVAGSVVATAQASFAGASG